MVSEKLFLYFAAAYLLLFLSSCGVTGRINKKSAAKGMVIESGVASWYGPNFNGRPTANGEKFDMNGLTAAHRTLPFNTVLRVENQDNGKSVIVRVNDRGPFAKDRIIDLAKGAAKKIGMLGPGTANVKLVLVKGDLKKSRTTDLKIATYTVQLGSYLTERDALGHAQKIKGSRVEKIVLDDKTIYRVYYGIYADKDDAVKKQKKLQRAGFDGYVKQIEN